MSKVIKAVLASALLLPLAALAEEPVKLMEEVTVVGAVRSSAAVQVADIDLPGDEALAEMPVVTE
ncbi:hypothetical protein NCG89_06765 [Spongiibacter taiwanensis]|uniref:hypothetical protein n=1 Tax=Spongiibacter taiwanensis TaxID=1748242 RepID=UPI002035686E|nr:hypothetical protein [Spongiibacter taiwanensis]USA44470.1 hypothetical protein NCG89_06765 [Spongiibacter taiwanensis]